MRKRIIFTHTNKTYIKLSWFYNWGLEPVYQHLKKEEKCSFNPRSEVQAEFVPMQWGNFNIPEIGGFYNSTTAAGNYFLGFNEPNHQVRKKKEKKPTKEK